MVVFPCLSAGSERGAIILTIGINWIAAPKTARPMWCHAAAHKAEYQSFFGRTPN